jgi:hypothetical protein
MRKKHNVTKRNVATINLQQYNASTTASVVVLVHSCKTNELRKSQLMENYSVTVKLNSSQRVFY